MIEVSQIIENITINTEELTQEAIINTSEVVEVVLLEVGESIQEAPIDGQIYGRKDASWEAVTGGASSADDITETATRVFVTPEEKEFWNINGNPHSTTLQQVVDAASGFYKPESSYTFTDIENGYVQPIGAISLESEGEYNSDVQFSGDGSGVTLFVKSPPQGAAITAYSEMSTALSAYSPFGYGFYVSCGTGISGFFNSETGAKIVSFNAGSVERAFVASDGSIVASKYRISSLNTAPANATATGTLGEIRITADFIYVCTATNTWRRTALTTW